MPMGFLALQPSMDDMEVLGGIKLLLLVYGIKNLERYSVFEQAKLHKENYQVSTFDNGSKKEILQVYLYGYS